MNMKSFHLTVQGASHIKKSKECQDVSASFSEENAVIGIVCDGHGGDDYMRSAFGASFCCEAARKNIREFIDGTDADSFFKAPDENLRRLEACIINDWNEAVYAHVAANPFTEEELAGVSERARRRYAEGRKTEKAYGTTLLAVALTPEYWFGIHIGDGKCVTVSPEGEFSQPIPWDSKCFLNLVTSICDSDAIGNFRHFYARELPAAVLIGSDGIDDCFKDNEQLYELYRTMLYSMSTTDFDQAVSELADYLPRLSAMGSGDDLSVAGILDIGRVAELEMVKSFEQDLAKKEAERVNQEKEDAKGDESSDERKEQPDAEEETPADGENRETPALDLEKEREISASEPDEKA